MDINKLIPDTQLRNLFGPFEDKEYYLSLGKEQADRIIEWLHLTPESNVLDVGCGCGRIAIHYLNYIGGQGKYIGIDVDKRFISYCNDNIAILKDNFQFQFIDVYNGAYARDGKLNANEVVFPVENESVDCVILWSVFTHMNLNDIDAYLKEIYRVLKKGGKFIASLNLYNDFTQNQIKMSKSHLDIRHAAGENSYTINQEIPEWGFAHSEDKLKEMYWDTGFFIREIKYGIWSCKEFAGEFHDCIIVEK